MPDYKKLYLKMFNGVTDAIEDLKKLQIEAEELYLKFCEDESEGIAERDKCSSFK